MSKLSIRAVPDYSDLLQDIDEALESKHRKHVLSLIWGRLFEDIPASHLRLQLKDKSSPVDSEDENTKVVVQTGQAIKYLADETSMSGFEDIENLGRDDK